MLTCNGGRVSWVGKWDIVSLQHPQIYDPGIQHERLRFDADCPKCPRCGTDAPGQPLPAAEFGGFLARRDEGSILDEEERFATRSLVTLHPQWDGEVVGRWTVGPEWALRWSRGEEVRWINEGPRPSPKDLKDNAPRLHLDAKGYLLCNACGRTLTPETAQNTTGGRRRARSGNARQDVYGHAESCLQAGMPPSPLALVTAGKAEVLRLLVPLPESLGYEALRSWGLSLGYALRIGMRHLYMLDGAEIEFVLEGPWKAGEESARHGQISLAFSDPSLGGSGYLRRIAEEFYLVAQRTLEHLDHPHCETACYRCLKSYQNQRFHEFLEWPRVIADLEALAQTSPRGRPLEIGDLDDPKPWLEAYAAGVGSPLELKFLRLFEKHGFHPEKQVPVSPNDASPPISVADFAVPEQRLAIYIDGAAFHIGANLRRDCFIRDRLRNGNPPWSVEELRAADLALGEALVKRLCSILGPSG